VYLLICNIAYLHTKDNRTKPICPLNWEQRKLGDESVIVAGGDVDKSKLLKVGRFPVLANALTNDGVTGYYENDFRIEGPAVTVTGRGDVGHAKARKFNFTPTVRLLAVKSEHDVDFLESAINNQKTIVESTGVPQLTAPQLANYRIHFPKLEEEEQIGYFFKILSDTITLHQRKLDSLHKLKTAYLQQLFPQNGELVPRLRFAKYNENWEQRKLGDSLSLLKDGTHGTHQDVADGEIFLLSAKNIKNGEVKITDSDRKISKAEYEKIHQNFELKKGDVLLTIVGSIGETAIINNPENITFQRSVAYLRPKDNLSPYYLYSLITDYKFQRELKTRQVVSAQPGIYLGDLSVIPIKYPIKLEEQQKIGKFFKTLDDTIKLHQHKVDEVIKLKKAYLQKMFI